MSTTIQISDNVKMTLEKMKLFQEKAIMKYLKE